MWWMLLGCVSGWFCNLESTLPTYRPDCNAVLVLWPTESLLSVDDRLEVWLPGGVQPGEVYGGTTGQPAYFSLDGEPAERLERVEFGSTLEQVYLRARFSGGEIEGSVQPEVQQGN